MYAGWTDDKYAGWTDDTYAGWTDDKYAGWTDDTYAGWTDDTYEGSVQIFIAAFEQTSLAFREYGAQAGVRERRGKEGKGGGR